MEVIASTTSNAGSVAALVEERKLALYGNLVPPAITLCLLLLRHLYNLL